MVCENCPFGELVQIDSFIWMVNCTKEDVLMSRQDGCNLPETGDSDDL